MLGPGQYDDEATLVRERTQAQAVVLLIAGGTRGNGTSIQSMGVAFLRQLPSILRRLADELEADAKRIAPDYDADPEVGANVR
jgi:hypothetical protein